METTKIQIYDSIPCGILLALSGGCMDAYSYLFRGHVFANAQTGNMILFGLNLAGADFSAALRYLWPILSFIAGLIITNVISYKKSFLQIHWKQISVFFEAVILVIVAFVPEDANSAANCMISFACGIQVESFRNIHDNKVATTMCIGNLRNGMFNLNQYVSTREKIYLKRAYLYFLIIIAFILGAIAEGILIHLIGTYAILLSPALLIAAYIFMFRGPLTFDGENYI